MSDNLDIKVENGIQTLELRKGESYRYHYPEPVNISGVTIGAIMEFLSKSNIEEEGILDSVICYSYDKLIMRLIYMQSERNPYAINASIVINPDLEQFEINKGKKYSPFALADFIKMNRHLFESKSVAMELVSVLKNIKASVNKAIESNRDDRGNRRALIDQVVQTNIPETFNIELPIFKGQAEEIIPVEIVLDEDLECMLVSPDLKEMIAIHSENLIGAELDKIRILHPQLRIYQQ